MQIRYQNGTTIEALIVSISRNVMRVAARDGNDVLEFRLTNDVWISEDCEPVEFDFTMMILAAVGIVPTADLTVEEAPEVPCATPDVEIAQRDYLN